MFVLNIGAGKIDTKRFDKEHNYVIHIDKSYGVNARTTLDIQNDISIVEPCPKRQVYCGDDIFYFIDNFRFKFDLIIAERVFEHLEYVSGEIGRLLEGLNVLTNDDAKLEIVVPNHLTIAKMLIAYEKNSLKFNHIKSINTKLIINTEMNNIRQDPHLSIWTPVLAKEYIESEGTWKIEEIIDNYFMNGRNIYMKLKCRKTNIAELEIKN